MNKISVILTLNKTTSGLDSILNQSYQNIEIIALYNNLSQEQIDNYKKIEKLKLIKINDSNKWNNRIIGFDNSTGDYISFIEENDYIDVDYYRTLIKNANANNSDIVISNYVEEKKGKYYSYGLTYNTNDKVYNNNSFFETYIKQTGRNERYHPSWNKLIKKELMKKIIKVDDIKRSENDLYFTTIAAYYSKTVSFCDSAIYYREQKKHSNIKESITKANDLIKSFEMMRTFCKKIETNFDIMKKIDLWEGFYLSKLLEKNKKNNNIKPLLENKSIKYYYEKEKDDKSWDNYQEIKIQYNDELEKIKKEIMNPDIKIVSFDMFDTLILRPFLLPADMFILLNKKFHELFNTSSVVDFGQVRPKSERELRLIKNKEKIYEITLDEIYEYIGKTYNLDEKKLNKIKEEELKMELHFCYIRKTGYELYELAKSMGKRVILTSDIYLLKDSIIKILEKNGYSFDAYYVSSELRKTKADGTIFEYIKRKEKTDKILHIGDNYFSDFVNAEEHGIKAARLIRTIDVILGYSPIIVNNCGYLYKYFASFNIDHIPYEQNLAVRCSMALAANYYFDNPFRPFSEKSDFNGDPYFIGYYNMGMHLLSLCDWLYKDTTKNNIDSLSFMARDGYLPYEAMKIYEKELKLEKKIKFNYTYVSRKSLMPLLLKDKTGISMIDTYLNYDILTPEDLMKQFERIMTINEKSKKNISKYYKLNKKFKTVDDFNNCLSIIYDNCFDEKKYNEYYKMCKEYFDSEFTGNAATFDVGYSGKPEAIISDIIGKPLHTYFIHTNNSDAYKNSVNAKYQLKTFFDFKPTISGALSELFISYVGPSCVGYEYKDNKVVPQYGKEKNYNYYNLDMIKKVQESSLLFVKDFCDFFANYYTYMDMNKYYMSLPIEYYYHYAKKIDRYPIKNLLFEANVNQFVDLEDFILDIKKNYTQAYTRGEIPSFYYENEDPINYQLPRTRMGRIIYYLLFDRKQLKKKWIKWKNKKNNPELLPRNRFKRIIYYIIFDKKSLKRKILK